MFDLDAKFGCN